MWVKPGLQIFILSMPMLPGQHMATKRTMLSLRHQFLFQNLNKNTGLRLQSLNS